MTHTPWTGPPTSPCTTRKGQHTRPGGTEGRVTAHTRGKSQQTRPCAMCPRAAVPRCVSAGRRPQSHPRTQSSSAVAAGLSGWLSPGNTGPCSEWDFPLFTVYLPLPPPGTTPQPPVTHVKDTHVPLSLLAIFLCDLCELLERAMHLTYQGDALRSCLGPPIRMFSPLHLVFQRHP